MPDKKPSNHCCCHLTPGTKNKSKSVNGNLAEEVAPAEDYPHIDIHGLPDVWTTQHGRARQLFWTIVLTISVIVGVISCVSVSIEYQSHPKATRMEIQQVDKLELPRVTICCRSADVLNVSELWTHLVNEFPDQPNATLTDLTRFIVAGSGFQKMLHAYNWSRDYRHELNSLYRQLRGDLSVVEYFHSFFERFGVRCEALLLRCRLGGHWRDCCKMFEASFTIRRGRCFSLRPTDQEWADERGKLILYMRQQQQFHTVSHQETIGDRQTLVAFVTEQRLVDIMPFPRYFIRPGHFCKMRISKRQISLMKDGNRICNETVAYGEGTCYLKYMWAKFRHDFNCTVPYWPMEGEVQMKGCEPLKLIEHYEDLIETESVLEPSETPCGVPCIRSDFRVTYEDQSSPVEFSRWKYDLRLEVSYTSLEYEDVTEVRTVTFFGFISQLGGQLGLFTGSSIISLCQLALFVSIYCRRRLMGPPTVVPDNRQGTTGTVVVNRSRQTIAVLPAVSA